jgi:hypothetical protein
MGSTPLSWVADSSLNTGAGLPWGAGDQKGNWDISKSALNTGAGLPWGPSSDDKYSGRPETPSPGTYTPIKQDTGTLSSDRTAYVNPVISARAQNRLEDQIKLSLRKTQPKNVEFNFNAEQNPFKQGAK